MMKADEIKRACDAMNRMRLDAELLRQLQLDAVELALTPPWIGSQKPTWTASDLFTWQEIGTYEIHSRMHAARTQRLCGLTAARKRWERVLPKRRRFATFGFELRFDRVRLAEWAKLADDAWRKMNASNAPYVAYDPTPPMPKP